MPSQLDRRVWAACALGVLGGCGPGTFDQVGRAGALPAPPPGVMPQLVPPSRGAPPGPSPTTPTTPAGAPTFTADPVFDTQVLHRIDIRVDAEDLPQLALDTEVRVACTITFDGITLADAGIRRKVGKGSRRALDDKPGFSIKLNDFVKGQKLMGLSKLLLNNSVQDPSFVNEHVAYYLARSIGLMAPLTAHALVTFNGSPYGLYVIKEAINEDFLQRNGWGKPAGNLYEGGDFIGSPETVDLKDEEDEGRSRQDVRDLSRLVQNTPDADWVELIGRDLNLEDFIAGFALESLIDHWDGYFFSPNNYYAYASPENGGMFHYIPHGMDQVFKRIRDPRMNVRVFLGNKLLAIPETRAMLQAKLNQIVRSMNVADLHGRIDGVAAILRGHTPGDPRTEADFRRFAESTPGVKAALTRLKNHLVPTL